MGKSSFKDNKLQLWQSAASCLWSPKHGNLVTCICDLKFHQLEMYSADQPCISNILWLLNNWWNKLYWLWAHLFMGDLAPRSRMFSSFNYSGKWCHSKQEILLFNTWRRGLWQQAFSSLTALWHQPGTPSSQHIMLLTCYTNCLALLLITLQASCSATLSDIESDMNWLFTGTWG